MIDKGLGANPKRSIGIEDAQAVIEAINSSEMFSVGVGNTLCGADYQVGTTNHLQWKSIKEAYEHCLKGPK